MKYMKIKIYIYIYTYGKKKKILKMGIFWIKV